MRPTTRLFRTAPIVSTLLCATLVYPQVVVAAPSTATPDAKAEDGTPDQARRHFDRGVDLFADGDFASALFEFETAHRRTGNAHLLYNIAVCHYELHEYAAATVAYRKYMAQLEGNLDDERRRQVRDRLDKLDLRVGTVIVESEPSGAVVSSDGEKLGVTPLETTLDLGERKLLIVREGYQQTAEQVRVVGGERVSVAVELKPQRVEAPVVVAPPASGNDRRAKPVDDQPAQPDNRGLRTGAIVSAAIAGAAGIGAAVAGGLAVRANRDLESERGMPTTRDSLADLASSRDSSALATDVLLVVTAVAAVTSVALGATYLARRKKAAGSTARVQLDPRSMRLRF